MQFKISKLQSLLNFKQMYKLFGEYISVLVGHIITLGNSVSEEIWRCFQENNADYK